MPTTAKLRVCAAAVIGLITFSSSLPALAQSALKPVTFTQQGWKTLGQSLIYNSWRYAFANFSFYGFTRRNWLYAGCSRTMSVEGSRSALSTLINWLPQNGPALSLSSTQDYQMPVPIPNAGSLAGEVVALTMNVAYNDVRLMPRSPGYDLEQFIVLRGLMKGRTVGQVLDIADRVLGGEPPSRYGVSNMQALVDVLRAINGNYEFISYSIATDRGYLQPNRPLGRPDPPHDPHVP
jgi:hypothetical protein